MKDSNLYHQTLLHPSGISHVVYGNFSQTDGFHEIAVGRGTTLELWKVNDEYPPLQRVGRPRYVGGTLRGMCRLGTRLVIVTESNSVGIVEFDAFLGFFALCGSVKLPFTNSRWAPNYYCCADCFDRCVLFGALQQNLCCVPCISDPDDENSFLLSDSFSVYERQNSIILDVKCVSRSESDPPRFAVLFGIEDKAERELCFFDFIEELQLVSSVKVSRTAHSLAEVSCEGYIAVCCNQSLSFFDIDKQSRLCGLRFPRIVYNGDGPLEQDQSVLFCGYCVIQSKLGTFLIIQNEIGDFFRVSLSGGIARVRYLGRLPQSSCMTLIPPRGIFVGKGFTDSMYVLVGLAEGDQEKEWKSSADYFDEDEDVDAPVLVHQIDKDTSGDAHIRVAWESPSLAGIIDMKVVPTFESRRQKQILMMSRTPVSSSVHLLRHGISPVLEAVNDVAGSPLKIFSLSTQYVLLSFVNKTLVLAIEEEITQTDAHPFNADTATIHAASLGDAFVQFHKDGAVIVKGRKVESWACPQRKSVLHADTDKSQAIVALSAGDLLLLRLEKGKLSEKRRRNMGLDVVALSLFSSPHEPTTSVFAVAAFSNFSCQIISIPDFRTLSTKSLGFSVTSLSVLSPDGRAPAEECIIVAGSDSGEVHRIAVDLSTGEFVENSETSISVGKSPVHTASAFFGCPCVVASGDTSIILHYDASYVFCLPLHVAQRSVLCQTAVGLFVGHDTKLSVYQVPRCIEPSIKTYELRGQGRRVAYVENSGRVVAISNNRPVDANLGSTGSRDGDTADVDVPTPGDSAEALSFPGENEDDTEMLDVGLQDGSPMEDDSTVMAIHTPAAEIGEKIESSTEDLKQKGEVAKVSVPVVEVIDMDKGQTLALSPGESSLETYLDVTVCKIGNGEAAIVVSCCRNFDMMAMQADSPCLRAFVIEENNLEFVDEYQFHDYVHPPTVMTRFLKGFVVGLKGDIFFFEMTSGRRFMNVARIHDACHQVLALSAQDGYLCVGCDVKGLLLFRFLADQCAFERVAVDSVPRVLSAVSVVDKGMVAGGMKFGTFAVAKVLFPVSEKDGLRTTPHGPKRDVLCSQLVDSVTFNIGDIVTGLSKEALGWNMGPWMGEGALMYCTVMGTIGRLDPVPNTKKSTLLLELQECILKEMPLLSGEDYHRFRSRYVEEMGVIDGDICELFLHMPNATQESIADSLGKTRDHIANYLVSLRMSLHAWS